VKGIPADGKPVLVVDSELLLDFVRWQNRFSKWISVHENTVDDYINWKK
jgi:hypothetical protein